MIHHPLQKNSNLDLLKVFAKKNSKWWFIGAESQYKNPKKTHHLQTKQLGVKT